MDIVLPALTWTMTQAKINKWLKQPGDEVKAGEPLFEVEMEKANVEVESPADGVLAKILAPEGTVVPFLDVVGVLAAEGEDIGAFSTGAAVTGSAPETIVVVEDRSSAAASGPSGLPRGVRATPLAKSAARQLNVPLEKVVGTGPAGRIVEKDVKAYAEKAVAVQEAAAIASAHAVGTAEQAVIADTGTAECAARTAPGELVELSRTQKITGQRMRKSLDEAPHFWLHRDVDVSNLEELRQKVTPRIEKDTGSKPSFTVLLVKVCAAALRADPRVNAMFENGALRTLPNVNIAVAIATANGLTVPVIKDADRKSLSQITADLTRLRDRAQTSSFKADDLLGGTFTISNLGMFGIDSVDSIINPPEAALLSVGRIVRKPVAEGDKVVIRPIMHLCLAVDHRALDGAAGAMFLADVAKFIEDPLTLL